MLYPVLGLIHAEMDRAAPPTGSADVGVKLVAPAVPWEEAVEGGV